MGYDGKPELLETTPEHPFYTQNGWVNAGELKAGDKLMQSGNKWGTVQYSRTVTKPQEMYNLSVDVAHTFFVGEGQWLVHNDPPKYYRGGKTPDLTPKPGELKIKDGMVQPTRGVSLHTDPQHLQRFGGAHPINGIPDELEIVQQGKDPNHYELRAKQPMLPSKFQELLKQVKFGDPCE